VYAQLKDSIPERLRIASVAISQPVEAGGNQRSRSAIPEPPPPMAKRVGLPKLEHLSFIDD
jgi:hypothetical protein